MDATILQNLLQEIFENLHTSDCLQDACDEAAEELEDLQAINTFEQVGMLTSDQGLVLSLADGSEFQITIVQSR